ncbi:MAG TPA: CHAD domain-containing protein [Solirubrobacteraceae bacterium]|nr:CHAD domain-containing protein [Solirubrobacteraceae bacterium]
MAVAKNGRRVGSGRGRRRRLGLGPAEGVSDGLRRMALEQTDLALEQVEAAEGEHAAKAVHETRKAIKRLRAIVRLLEGELGRDGCAREQTTLRTAAAHLAGARDAEVMLSTVDALVSRSPRRLAGRTGIAKLRRHLEAERAQAERRMLEPANRIRVADELRIFRGRVLRWELAPADGLAPVEDGLRRVYRQGRKRYRRAAGKHGGRMRTMHQWRKRVKDLRYAAEALRRLEEQNGRALRLRGKRRKQTGAESRRLRRTASRADDLSELLGEEHDLAVLGAWLAGHGAEVGVGKGIRRRLRKLIGRRRRKLRRRALREGKRLYRRKPGAFLRRAARSHRAGAVLSRR